MENNDKQIALELAIKSNCGSSYNDEGRMITDPDKIIAAAKKFEAYLKETNNV